MKTALAVLGMVNGGFAVINFYYGNHLIGALNAWVFFMELGNIKTLLFGEITNGK